MEKKGKNVYELAQERLDIIFREFDTVCVSFSGGKDSGVLLNLCMDYIRRNCPERKLCVFHMDYEIQYHHTIEYVDHILEANKDILEVYRVCVPFRVATCTSMYQSYWRPWDEEMKDIWVRQMPKNSLTKDDFPFYTPEMWDYEFQMYFAKWLHQKKDAVRSCFLIGIRTQESFNRWRSIHLSRKYQMYHNYRWTSKLGNDLYNAYPLYDWKTVDIWTANGKFGYAYNHLYDLYYMAGVSIERQRVASPFLCEAQDSLKLYRVIDPNTWGKMIGRVNGVNFTGIYGVVLGASALCVNITALSPYGVPYSSPIAPLSKNSSGDMFARAPWRRLLKHRFNIKELRGADCVNDALPRK